MNKRTFINFVLFSIKIFLVMIPVFFLNNCGIEDSFYFQEPTNLHVDGTNPALPVGNIMKFTGFNQEVDSNKYLIIGYDVYYYFGGNESAAKKAQVRYPVVNFDIETSTLINFKVDESARFARYDNTFELYKDFTIPVTTDMIENVLYEGNNDNVVFYFYESLLFNSADKNPKRDGKVLYMEYIYPNKDLYENYDWGKKENDFRGFYDKDFYNYYGIAPDAGYTNRYTAVFYVVARGFSSQLYDLDFISSIKSNYIEVTFEVDPATVYIP